MGTGTLLSDRDPRAEKRRDFRKSRRVRCHHPGCICRHWRRGGRRHRLDALGLRELA